LANGESVKCTSAPIDTAPGEGSTGLKSSIVCVSPCVHGVHASVPRNGSTVIASMRSPEPCTRASIAPGTVPSVSFTRIPAAPAELARRRDT